MRSPVPTLVALVLLAACVARIPGGAAIGDPGIQLEPIDLQAVGEFEWRIEVGDVELRTGPLGGLIGWKWESPEFRLKNRGKSPVVLQRAELATGGRTFVGGVFGLQDGPWKLADPGRTERITLNWEFGAPISEVYGEDAQVTLALRVGDKVETVRIKYVRRG